LIRLRIATGIHTSHDVVVLWGGEENRCLPHPSGMLANEATVHW
jgi:hypothetical protein